MDPVELDWGDVEPSWRVRVRIEELVRRAALDGPSIGLRKTPSGYEARLEGMASVELRLRDSDLGSAVQRAIEMIERTGPAPQRRRP